MIAQPSDQLVTFLESLEMDAKSMRIDRKCGTKIPKMLYEGSPNHYKFTLACKEVLKFISSDVFFTTAIIYNCTHALIILFESKILTCSQERLKFAFDNGNYEVFKVLTEELKELSSRR